MRERLTSDGAMPLVSWAGLLISLLGLVALAVVSIVESEWEALATVGFGLSVVLFVVYQLWRRHKPLELEETTVFRPFAPLEPANAWPHSGIQEIVEGIESALSGGDKIPMVVGASGVGKSTLLNVLVREKIEAANEDLTYTVISSHYSDIVRQLEDLIADCDRDHPRVIVLDQFEQWVALVAPKDREEREKEEGELCAALINATQKTGCAAVISVRREWYFNLGFLNDLVPDPSGVCSIVAPPLAAEEEDPMHAAIRRAFLDVLGEDERELVDEVMTQISRGGRLSPLRAQIVGAVLERRQEAGLDVNLECFKDELGGAAGAIETYFTEALDGSPRPHLCMKILFALSVKRRFRTKEKLSTLAETLYEDIKPIRRALEYLVAQRLVVKQGTAKYAIAHDFLADFFNIKSGADLNPGERDNIQAYTATRGEHNSAVNDRARGRTDRRRPLGTILIFMLVGLMTVRFLYFGVETNLVGDTELARPLVGNWFDATYLLIMVPYVAWIVYVGLFYDRLLVHMNENKIQRFFTIFIMVNLVISVLLGIFVPYAWLIGIGSAGVVFAAKMLLLSRHQEISRAARKRLRDYSTPTLFNLIFAGGLGIGNLVLSILFVDSPTSVNTWILSNVVASLMVTYWCLAVATLHIGRGGVADLLGLIGRPRTVAYALLDD